MHITGLKTFVVGNPPPTTGGRYFIFLKLISNDGVEGVGEVYNATFSPTVVVKMIEDVFAAHVENMDPFRIETLWRNVYGRGYSQRPDITLMGVLSGLEMALWDINGKALGKPVCELLGGKVHERLRTYTYIYPRAEDADANVRTASVYEDPDAAATRAADYLARGFTALKFDPAGPYSTFDPRQPSLAALTRSELFCKRLREAVGDSADLLFGTHGQFTASGAIRLARRLEPYDPLWFEEPVPPEMPDCCRLARPRSCRWRWAASAACWRPRRSPAWPKPIMPRSRRICTAAPSRGRPTSSCRRAPRTSSSWRASRPGAVFTQKSSRPRCAGRTAS
jgi:galactonate dehydratase